MNNLFGIGIPTINQAELLIPALSNYLSDFPNTKIFVVDNGQQSIPRNIANLNVTVPFQPLCVAASWNLLCNLIYRESPNALILNDDIELGKTEEQIYSLLTTIPPRQFYVGPHHWCSFILPKETFDRVGPFDETFEKAYFEDNDYSYRMDLAGCKRITTPVLAPVIYRESLSIKKDRLLSSGFEKNKQYYVSKWGAEPGKEIFKTPFNI